MTEKIRRNIRNKNVYGGFGILLDLVYPRCCPLCGTVLKFREKKVCESCIRQQKRVEPPYCFRCGKTIEDRTEEYCSDCSSVRKSYQRGFPAFVYEGAIKNALYEFKYDNQRSYGEFFGECILDQYEKEFEALQFDGIIPVPIHKEKRRKRGYNQAEILADVLGERLKIPVYSSYIVRVINTNPQKELKAKTRMKNLKNAFKIGQNKVQLKRVLLVDDIYTSGATIEACTQVLIDADVEEVYYTSVAIGNGYSE